MTIGQKLQELRKKQGVSQEALAEKLSVTRQTVSKWELDQSTPDVDMLVMISDIFDVSLDSLMRKNEMTAPRMAVTASEKRRFDMRLVFGIPMLSCPLLIFFILFIISIFKPVEYINEYEGIYKSGFTGFLYAYNLEALFTILVLTMLGGIFLIAKYLGERYDWF